VKLSIIIVSWNTCQITTDCLESIVAHSPSFDYEVIVVDNASQDGSVEAIRRRFPQVRVIENTENLGFARANNIGLEYARAEYCLLLNSDTLILDNALDCTVAFADTHPQAAIVSCRILGPDFRLQRDCFMFPSVLNMFLWVSGLSRMFARSRFFGRERMTWWDFDSVREVDVVAGCFMLVRRSAIDEVGPMDESFFMYFEETDWCYRFKQAGWKVMFFPGASIIHYGGASTGRVKASMIAEYARSMVRFFKKHKGPVQECIARTFLTSFYLGRIPYWVLRGAVSREDRRCCFERARAYLVSTKAVWVI
jgi:GT2 family glycosyltransferase